ncbi:MAG: hypothetical protein ACLGJB_03610 [Blastocatellia bacterium]
MAETGGAATVLGIWYQSLGAVASLVSDWKFDGERDIVDGESLMSSSGERLQLFLEYFDMDAAIQGKQGVQLIQFKVSSQQKLRDFTLDEIREIFQNATKAILDHESEPIAVRIAGFLVASNRPAGKRFTALQETAKKLATDINNPNSLSIFSIESAPFLFSDYRRSENGKRSLGTENGGEARQGDDTGTAKNMLDFAHSVTRLKAKDWGFDGKRCAEACLKAMACFAFAKAQPAKLEKEVQKWFRTWGIKPEEDDRYITRLLGKFLWRSSNGQIWDRLSIMQDVFESENAVPLTSFEAWESVIHDLREQLWPDPPTKDLINLHGIPDWMLDRSKVLGNLPDFAEPPTATEVPEDLPSLNTETPRIFALVGPGGVGKSSLLAHLFVKIGSRMWDWEAKGFRSNSKFNGYPIILEADERAVEAIEGNLKKWSRRKDAAGDPVDRFAVANGVEGNDAAVWLGIDGVDEMDENSLIRFAKAIVNHINKYPNLRIVLTSRPSQFDYMQSAISGRRLVRRLDVVEFDQGEAWDALLNATNYEILRDQASRFRIVGTRRDSASIVHVADPGGFQSSIQQPLFIGVIRDMYEENGIKDIQAAYDGDPDGLKKVATKYIHVFCDRIRKRLKCADINERGIFNALKQLAEEVNKPQVATKSHWENVCNSHLGEITGYKLYRQCLASGLIREVKLYAFEWRHLSVGRYLATMEENPEWE